MDDNEFWIMSEYCSLGDLNEYLMIYDVNEGHRIHIMSQVSSGLAFLHAMEPHPIVHRDIKPGNTLLTLLNKHHVVKLCDFGLSRVLPNMSDLSLTKGVGTRAYKAPELFNTSCANYDEKVDVFATGIMMQRLMQTSRG